MPAAESPFSFRVTSDLPNGVGRAGVISTPHGQIATPAFIVVGTKATVKAVLPETVAHLGGQGLADELAYLRPKGLAVDGGTHGWTPF